MKRKLQCKLQDDGTCLINLDDAVKMVEYEIADAMCLEVLLQDDLATAQVIRSPDAFIIGQCVFIISHSAQPICIPSLMSQINQAHNVSQTSLDSQVNARAQQAPAACSSCCNLR